MSRHALAWVTPDLLLSGDSAAWEALRSAYRPRCIIVAEGLGSLEADDLWQLAALRLWRALVAGKFDGRHGGEMGNYLLRIISSVAADVTRQSAHRDWARHASYQALAETLGVAADESPWLRVEPPTAGEHADFWQLIYDILGEDAPRFLRRIDGERQGPDSHDPQRNSMGLLRRRKRAILQAYYGD